MFDPKAAETLQDEIYEKMPAAKKLKIAGDFYLLGKKLNSLKHGHRETRRTFSPNHKNLKQT